MTSQALALTSDIAGFDNTVRNADHALARTTTVYPPFGTIDVKDNDCVAKPGFFGRILEAIGHAYYVPTSDGRGICVYPPI